MNRFEQAVAKLNAGTHPSRRYSPATDRRKVSGNCNNCGAYGRLKISGDACYNCQGGRIN